MGVGRNATQERVKYILKMGFTRPPFIKGKRWGSGGWHPTFLVLLSLVPVPNNFSPAIKRTDTEFRNGFGFNTRGQNQVTGIFFTVVQDGTLALCDLSFSTNLVEIDSASVSCQILYDNVGDSVVLGFTEFDWTFFSKMDEEVYEVAASITFNPTTEAIPRLKLCFSSTCTASISSVVEPAATESICDCESSLGAATALGISSSSFYSSQPEGFAFTFPSGGASPSSSSSSGLGPTTTTTTTPTTTTTTTTHTTTTTAGATNSQGSAVGDTNRQEAHQIPAETKFTRGSHAIKQNWNVKEDFGQKIQNKNNFWRKSRQLDTPLCLTYPPASSSSSSSSSS